MILPECLRQRKETTMNLIKLIEQLKKAGFTHYKMGKRKATELITEPAFNFYVTDERGRSFRYNYVLNKRSNWVCRSNIQVLNGIPKDAIPIEQHEDWRE